MNWPAVEGRYEIGNLESPIAVCTNASIEKIKLDMEKVAIIGKCVTENIGIEKIIKNIIAKPSIRFLIVCGKPSKGHFVGQAFSCLKQNGTDSEKRIIGAKGNMPFLKNLEDSEIDHFRQQVDVIDLMEIEEQEKIMNQVNVLLKKNPGKFDKDAPKVVINEVQAVKYEDFVEDPSGYFFVTLDKNRKLIVVEHYKNGKLSKRIIGDDNEAIRDTISNLNLIQNHERAMQHGIYLGREIYKAELALKNNLDYEQDSEIHISPVRDKGLDEEKRGDSPLKEESKGDEFDFYD